MSEWTNVEDGLPKVPKDKFGVTVIACWYCCEDEPQVVSQVSFSKREQHFTQLAYGTDGCRWIPVVATHWMPLPTPPSEEGKHGQPIRRNTAGV